MPKLLWTVCCERAIVDQETNILSLMGVIEAIRLPAPRTVFGGHMYVVSLWEKEPHDREGTEDFTYRVRLIKPSGEYMGEHSVQVSIEAKRLRTIVAITGVPFEGPGRYHWVVETLVNDVWQRQSELPLDVELQEPAGA